MEEQMEEVVNDINALADKVNDLKEKVLDKMNDRSQYIVRLERQLEILNAKLAQAQSERDMLLNENEKLRLKCAKFDGVSTSDNEPGVIA